MRALVEEMSNAGAFKGTEDSWPRAVRRRRRQPVRRARVTDGPFTETKEHVGAQLSRAVPSSSGATAR
jgi:hypothetical protein